MSSRRVVNEDLFDGRHLARLLVPLLIEQFLIVFLGLADMMMVSRLSAESVSAVSLVDNVNVLMNQVFAALATGGAVIAAQYLGKGERDSACASAEQLFLAVLGAAALVGIVVGVLHNQVLRITFGELEPAVQRDASVYMVISAMTYPFIGIFSAGSAMFRAMGNSKTTMLVSLVMTLVKVSLSAIGIYGLGLGVMGAALGTLISRMVSAGLYVHWIQNPSNALFIHSFRKLRWRFDLVKRILHIGVPTGVENGLFQFGKLLTLNLVAGLGTASVAANAIANSLAGLFQLPGNAMALALVTLVGQCMGAGNADKAASLSKRLVLLSSVSLLATMSVLVAFTDQLVAMFNLTGFAAETCVNLLKLFAPMTVAIWSMAFVMPCALRGAGDVRFTMGVSMASMWTSRVGLSYLLTGMMGFGLAGVWYAMYADWLVRAVCFVARFVKGKWKTIKVI